jgi:hypothetical protein
MLSLFFAAHKGRLVFPLSCEREADTASRWMCFVTLPEHLAAGTYDLQIRAHAPRCNGVDGFLPITWDANTGSSMEVAGTQGAGMPVRVMPTASVLPSVSMVLYARLTIVSHCCVCIASWCGRNMHGHCRNVTALHTAVRNANAFWCPLVLGGLVNTGARHKPQSNWYARRNNHYPREWLWHGKCLVFVGLQPTAIMLHSVALIVHERLLVCFVQCGSYLPHATVARDKVFLSGTKTKNTLLVRAVFCVLRAACCVLLVACGNRPATWLPWPLKARHATWSVFTER